MAAALFRASSPISRWSLRFWGYIVRVARSLQGTGGGQVDTASSDTATDVPNLQEASSDVAIESHAESSCPTDASETHVPSEAQPALNGAAPLDDDVQSSEEGSALWVQEMQQMERRGEDRELQYYLERRRRIFSLLLLVPLVAGILLSIYAAWISANYGKRTEIRILEISGLTLVGISIASALLRYLQEGWPFTRRGFFRGVVTVPPKPSGEEESGVRSSYRREQQQAKAHQLGEIPGGESTQGRIREFQEEAGAQGSTDSSVDIVNVTLARAMNRLKAEVAKQGWRGNLNLVIGIMSAAVGLAVLAWLVSEAKSFSHGDPMTVAVVYYVPRLSLVAFIEVFSYFFLRLYRGSLSEIKYFQNELTTLEAKYTALYVAIQGGAPEAIRQITTALAATERNVVLNKGQSTVELEQSKNDLCPGRTPTS